MNKKALQILDILVETLDLAGFDRKSSKHRDTTDQISLRVFRVRQKQNILWDYLRDEISSNPAELIDEKHFSKKFFEETVQGFRGFSERPMCTTLTRGTRREVSYSE